MLQTCTNWALNQVLVGSAGPGLNQVAGGSAGPGYSQLDIDQQDKKLSWL